MILAGLIHRPDFPHESSVWQDDYPGPDEEDDDLELEEEEDEEDEEDDEDFEDGFDDVDDD